MTESILPKDQMLLACKKNLKLLLLLNVFVATSIVFSVPPLPMLPPSGGVAKVQGEAKTQAPQPPPASAAPGLAPQPAKNAEPQPQKKAGEPKPAEALTPDIKKDATTGPGATPPSLPLAGTLTSSSTPPPAAPTPAASTYTPEPVVSSVTGLNADDEIDIDENFIAKVAQAEDDFDNLVKQAKTVANEIDADAKKIDDSLKSFSKENADKYQNFKAYYQSVKNYLLSQEKIDGAKEVKAKISELDYSLKEYFLEFSNFDKVNQDLEQAYKAVLEKLKSKSGLVDKIVEAQLYSDQLKSESFNFKKKADTEKTSELKKIEEYKSSSEQNFAQIKTLASEIKGKIEEVQGKINQVNETVKGIADKKELLAKIIKAVSELKQKNAIDHEKELLEKLKTQKDLDSTKPKDFVKKEELSNDDQDLKDVSSTSYQVAKEAVLSFLSSAYSGFKSFAIYAFEQGKILWQNYKAKSTSAPAPALAQSPAELEKKTAPDSSSTPATPSSLIPTGSPQSANPPSMALDKKTPPSVSAGPTTSPAGLTPTLATPTSLPNSSTTQKQEGPTAPPLSPLGPPKPTSGPTPLKPLSPAAVKPPAATMNLSEPPTLSLKNENKKNSSGGLIVAVQDMAKGFGRMVKAGATYFKSTERRA